MYYKLGQLTEMLKFLEKDIIDISFRIGFNSNYFDGKQLIENPDALFATLKQKIERANLIRKTIYKAYTEDVSFIESKQKRESLELIIKAYKSIISRVYKDRAENKNSTVSTVISIEKIQELLETAQAELAKLISDYHQLAWNYTLDLRDNVLSEEPADDYRTGFYPAEQSVDYPTAMPEEAPTIIRPQDVIRPSRVRLNLGNA